MATTLGCIKFRCSKKNILFNITLSDLLPLPQVCPDLAIQLSYTTKGHHTGYFATVDRIVPDLGYVPGNVRIISYKANAMKQNASLAELKTIACSWLELVKRLEE